MRFHVLGSLGVLDGDETVPLGPPQQQKLLAVLCTSPNKAISSDRLVDEIWGDTPPPSADHLVQVYVSRLRGLLGDFDGGSRILRQGTGYALRVEPNEIDAVQMEALADEALILRADDPDESRELLQEAIGMWSGSPFGSLRDESATLEAESTRLAERYLRALEDRVEIDLQQGRHRQVVGELDQLRAEYPYRERIWEQWMLALYQSGRQAEALRAFQALRTTLGEDLGIEPSPRVAELEERILLQDPTLLWEPPPPPCNVPVGLTTFVGRGAEMAEVSKLLETARLVTLTGPGGIGKTRLAAETSQQIILRFPDGIWWINLAPITDPDAIGAEVARNLGVAAQPGTTIEQSVVQSLVRRDALLILDNCEHLAAAVAELTGRILRGARRIHILATSRSPLRVTGEHVWMVPTLSMPLENVSADELPRSDAIRLFEERASMVEPHFTVDSNNSSNIVEICRRLDGMPLAIEMAAARLRVLSPKEIAASLSNRFDVLKRPERDVTARHETLRAAIDWSHALLQADLQTVFNNLAVFPGSFDLTSAAAVAFRGTEIDPLEATTALVDSSMISRVANANATSRFRFLETLREYGLERLREGGTMDQMRSAHTGYFIDLVESAADDIGEPAFVAWMDKLGQCYDDIQQTLEWSLKHHPRAKTLRLAPVLQHYWYRTGDAREAKRWGLRMVDREEEVPDELAAAAHTAVGFGATILAKDPQEAIKHIDRAVELYRNSADRRGLATALFGQANAALLVGDFDTMRAASHEALAVCDEIEYTWGRAGSLSMMSFAHFFGGGQLDEARTLAEEAVSLYRQVGDVGSQIVMNPISAIALQQGDLATAERYASSAAAIASGSGWEATALANLAEVMLAKGAVGSAEAMLRRAVIRALDSGLENWFRIALRDLAQVASRRGKHENAAQLIAASKRNMPNWGLFTPIYEAVESTSRDALNDQAYEQAAQAGFAMELDELLDLALRD